MKHISILVLNEAIVSSIDAARQLFLKVNEVLEYSGKSAAFKVELIGGQGLQVSNGIYSIQCDRTLEDTIQTDLIIVPMVCNGFPKAIDSNKQFVPWIVNHYNANSEIACLCVGSFILASTGLLDQKHCAVHWAAANEFRSLYPNVQVVDDKVITYENGIYTSGGGSNSYVNLLLCIVEKYVDRDTAVLFSKMLQIEIDRESQARFMIFSGQKNHGDKTIIKAQEYIENSYKERISVGELTNSLSLSRRNFERRFKKATSNTVMGYTLRVRIEAAKRILEVGNLPVENIVEDVGFTDVKTFRNAFRKITGLSPTVYRKKYSRVTPGREVSAHAMN